VVKLRHFDKYETVRFITFSCYRRFRLFSENYIYELFLYHLEKFRRHNNVLLLGFVIMPNHVHLVLYPQSELALGGAIGYLKSRFAYEIIQQWKVRELRTLNRLRTTRDGKEIINFWQKRCYDHNCRTPETVREKINYCHMNPVRAGLVSDPGEWRWSSYNWYQGVRDSIVHIDEIDLC
jgi:putative transposase